MYYFWLKWVITHLDLCAQLLELVFADSLVVILYVAAHASLVPSNTYNKVPSLVIETSATVDLPDPRTKL